MHDSNPATVDDLYNEPGKAELIAGKIVRMPALGYKPGRIVSRIARSLDDHAEMIGMGEMFTGGLAYTVPELSSGRESFSPDVSYYIGPLPNDPMMFIEGPPTLAVEVRDENDFGNPAEAVMAAKRADYFRAGTLVVWDVDPIAERIHVYRAEEPDRPTTYTRGHVAEAEPAVPRWQPEVDRIFG